MSSRVFAGAPVAGPVEVTSPGPAFGLVATNYKRARRGISRVRCGTANAILACVGDSTTDGNGTTWAQNYPSILAGLLNSDSKHPSTFGYSDVAQAVFNVLKTI